MQKKEYTKNRIRSLILHQSLYSLTSEAARFHRQCHNPFDGLNPIHGEFGNGMVTVYDMVLTTLKRFSPGFTIKL
jgi:hypothetical protein